jgi:hypothetical protein
MTKRPRWTAEEVAQNLSDDEDEVDDPDEPLMEGSDDEFSDLEFDSDNDDVDDNMMELDDQQPLSPLDNFDPGNDSDVDSASPTPSPSTSQAANG